MDKKILRWNFVFQYGWVLTNVFNSLILLPLYIKYINSNTLGVWLATTAILNWMTLADPGIGEVLQQNLAQYRGKKQYDEIGKSIGSGLVSSGIIVLVAIMVGYGCYFALPIIIDKDASQYPNLPAALIIAVIATGMSLVSFTLSGINQGLHNAAHVAISSLTANFLFLFVNLFLLFTGFGIMSIALANLTRALFINAFNIISLLRLLKRENMSIILQKAHFKRFIKIFSFTSASKIISGLSGSVDMLILARFIAPSMITVLEINKRPLNLTNSLIGRHSVALMPLISHAKGEGQDEAITSLIYKQFKFYTYVAMFAAFMFCLNYDNLITLWTGEGKYIGNTILFPLVTFNFLTLICYFMSNVGYALGDIKKNSQFNIVRNLVYAVLVYFGARYYGIMGTVVASLGLTLVADLFYFPYKVYRLGYFSLSAIKNSLKHWSVIIPTSILFIWGCKTLTGKVFATSMYFSKVIADSIAFTLFFILLLLITDNETKEFVKEMRRRILVHPLMRKVRINYAPAASMKKELQEAE
jgi:O-antigen/teichoic acid export membrane protein